MTHLTEEEREEAVKKLWNILHGAKLVYGEYINHDAEFVPEDSIHLPGVTVYFSHPDTMYPFLATAKKLFAETEGDHQKDGTIKPDYSRAIQRLPIEYFTVIDKDDQEVRCKQFPVHFSDAVLAVLSKPENLDGLKQSLLESQKTQEKTPDAPADKTNIAQFPSGRGSDKGRR